MAVSGFGILTQPRGTPATSNAAAARIARFRMTLSPFPPNSKVTGRGGAVTFTLQSLVAAAVRCTDRFGRLHPVGGSNIRLPEPLTKVLPPALRKRRELAHPTQEVLIRSVRCVEIDDLGYLDARLVPSD